MTNKPVVRVYHGFGDGTRIWLFGHVLQRSPLPQRKFKKGFWINAFAMVRLFFVKPLPNETVRLNWFGQIVEAKTEKDGFFKLEWSSKKALLPAWYDVTVMLDRPNRIQVVGTGKVLVPHNTDMGLISDIDDTFLISHATNLRKRLYLLLTKNARMRKPFEGASRHYRLLARESGHDAVWHPFFYVSSSEWNLYYYITEFMQRHDIPEGVLLLNQLKEAAALLKTGQTNHEGKFFRIARLLMEYPNRIFILLGDDTQRDPYIYLRVVHAFPNRIRCVYLRHVGKRKKPEIVHLTKEIQAQGVEVCYFNKSEEAIAHSKRVGLININFNQHEAGSGVYEQGDSRSTGRHDES